MSENRGFLGLHGQTFHGLTEHIITRTKAKKQAQLLTIKNMPSIRVCTNATIHKNEYTTHINNKRS